MVLTRYYDAKKDRESAHRDRKIELYDGFLEKLFAMFGPDKDSPSQEELTQYLRDVHRKLVLWSGPQVIRTYAEWHESLIIQPPRAPHLIKMIDFFLPLRTDLGHSNKGIRHEHIIRFILRNTPIFMSEYNKIPEVTFDEVARKVKELGLKDD